MKQKYTTLNADQKRQVVLLLSAGFLPAEVGKILRDEHAIELSSAAILRYDPRRPQGRTLSKQLKELFYREHEKFVEGLEQISLSHRTARVALLERVINDSVTDGDRKSLLKAVDTIRKEMQVLDYVDDEEGEGEDW